jgi:hypothetical protein
MKFRTEAEVAQSPFKICYSDKVFCIGSCFAERMEQKLHVQKFSTLLNPFGILFQPFAIANCIESVIEKTYFRESDLVLQDGIYHSLQHHGDFSDTEAQQAIEKINQKIDEAHLFLKEADVLLITFGTAIVFEHKASGVVVGNCHRIPQSEFLKRILTVEEVVARMETTLQHTLRFNKKLKFIFSVSPVRYLSFGMHENQLAKATLLLAIDALQKKFDEAYYFPAYEIVMDDLRDYRFMNEDLIHPNEQATEYVWDKFCGAFFSTQTMQLLKSVEEVVAASNHRPRFQNTIAHQKFLDACYSKTLQLQAVLPHANWSRELEIFAGKNNS